MHMKRYVTEFADDLLKQVNSNDLMDSEIKQQFRETVADILDNYKQGFITAREAVYCLAAGF